MFQVEVDLKRWRSRAVPLGALHHATCDCDRSASGRDAWRGAGALPWETVLQSLSRLLDANSVIIHKELRHGGGWGVQIGGDDRAYSDYFGHFAGVHPLAARSFAAPAGSVLTDQMIMPRVEFERTEFYQDWSRPNRFIEHLHVRLESSAQALVGLSFTRASGAREFGAADLDLVRRLAPHLRRAVATYEKLGEVRAPQEGLMDALDRMGRGVFGLDLEGRIAFANETAGSLLAAGDTLRVENGMLAASRPDHTIALRRMLRSVAGGDAPCALTLERPDGRSPLLLESIPMGSTASLMDVRPPPMILLLISDPEVDAAAAVASLRERYGLTATEGAVAYHTARGVGLAAVARALGIGQGTVRSHLKKVFEKTDTHRQAELAWIVSRLSQ